METMKEIHLPTQLYIDFILIILAAILTWIIPSGQFETVVENVAGMEKQRLFREPITKSIRQIMDKVFLYTNGTS